MDPIRRRWVEYAVIVAVVVGISAIMIPGFVSSRRASNERHASTSLKALSDAETEFRSNDRDGNGVQDFWTGDVAGLYRVKSTQTGQEIKLIELPLAQADGRPLDPLPGAGPDQGYRFVALERDNNNPPTMFQTDTDNSGRKVHHRTKFAICAYPARGGEGKYVFLVNEDPTIFRFEGSVPRTSWLSDEEVKQLTWPSGPLR